MELTLGTGTGIFEVLANVCRSNQEAVKQFVENAADAIQQAGVEEGRITVQLKQEPGEKGGVLREIVINDSGIGMDREKMGYILRHIGDSEKVELALRGEKGIGILAFALIADELHLASTATEGVPSSCLVLKKGWLRKGRAMVIEECSRHTHTWRGTAAYLMDILPEAAGRLTREQLKEYFGREFANDLNQGVYAMSISDDGEFEPVSPKRYRGIKAVSASLPVGGHGSAALALYVLPWEMADAAVSLYGRGGMRICLLTDLDDFKHIPWTDRRLEGYIRYDSLKRTADKTAVVQDQVYRAFATELARMEPEIVETVRKVSASSLERRFDIALHKAGRLIGKFLDYRDRGLLPDLPYPDSRRKAAAPKIRQAIPRTPANSGQARVPAAEGRVPNMRLFPAPEGRALARSWYDQESGCICVNREHSEFLLSQREDARCIRYLFSIWVKEQLLQEYGSDAEKLADEMVGMLAEAEPLLW